MSSGRVLLKEGAIDVDESNDDETALARMGLWL